MKIVLNAVDNEYYFDAEDGTAPLKCKRWLETSKKSEAHPDGKRWIVLPKGNAANRTYISEDKFEAEAVNGELVVEYNDRAPRTLGSTTVKTTITKYLDDATAEEYTTLVTNAVEAYKAAKASSKAKKLEEMTEEELLAFIEAKKNGTPISVKSGPKSFLDMFTEEEYNRYNEILAIAQENKANMPRAKRGPLSDEEKAARKIKRDQSILTKAEKLLAAMRAGSVQDTQVIDEDFE